MMLMLVVGLPLGEKNFLTNLFNYPFGPRCYRWVSTPWQLLLLSLKYVKSLLAPHLEEKAVCKTILLQFELSCSSANSFLPKWDSAVFVFLISKVPNSYTTFLQFLLLFTINALFQTLSLFPVLLHCLFLTDQLVPQLPDSPTITQKLIILCI